MKFYIVGRKGKVSGKQMIKKIVEIYQLLQKW